MSERASADRPGRPGDPDQPWNKQEFLDFLKNIQPDDGDELEGSSLEDLDERLQEEIISNYEIYSALDEEIEKWATVGAEKLSGADQRLLSSYVQVLEQLSKDVVSQATQFNQGAITGKKLAAKYQEVVVVVKFLHEHVHRLTKSVLEK